MKKKYKYMLAVIIILLFISCAYLGKEIISSKTTTQLLENNHNLKNQNSYEITDKDADFIIDDSIKKISTPVPLTIINNQNTSEDITYTYQISIEGISGAYKTTIGKETKYLVFDTKGNAEIEINSNEHFTIEELPSGNKYTIIQEENDDYNVTSNNIKSNTYTGTLSDSNKVIFNNLTKNSVEEKKPIEYNPNTIDPIIALIIVLIVAGITLLILSHKQMSKYENES